MPRKTRPTGIIYCRESNQRRRSRTGEIRRDLSRSLKEQEEVGRRDCERNGIDVVAVKREPKGASIYSPGTRTVWQETLELLASDGIDFLVTTESSRNQRDMAIYVMLRDVCRATGTKLMYNGRIFDLDDPDDVFITALDAAGDEREAGKTRKRVLRSVRARAAAGRPHGLIPYGYRRIYNPKTGEYIAQLPDDDTAPVVQRIYARIAAGATASGVAKELTRDGITPPTGRAKVWRQAAVRGIATSRTYLGERTLNGQTVMEQAWPPIVDENLFAVVQVRMAVRHPPIDSTAKRLLSGIAVCGVCGGRMYHSTGGMRRDAEGRPVSCRYVCRDHGCLGRNSDHLDKYVTAILLDLIAADERVGTDAVDPRIPQAAAELEGLKARLEAFTLSAASDDGITPARLATIERELQPKIDAAKHRLDALRYRGAMPDLGPLDIRTAWTLPAERGGLSLAQKRKIVRAWLTITVHPTARGSHVFNPAAVAVEPVSG